MKKVFLAAALSPVLGFSLAGMVAAQGGPHTADNPSNLVAQLEPMITTCDWKLRTLTGEPKGVMLLHNAKMKKILEDLQAGKSVDLNEVDAVIKLHALEGGRLLSW